MRNKESFCPYCMNPVTPGEPCKTCGLTSGTYTPSPHHLPPGTVLRERYLVGRVLGEGGFGITYIGCDLRLELKVAIKEYFPTDQANRVSAASITVTGYSGAAGSRFEEGKERFLNEARTMAKMDKQPVIVSVRDFFEANNTAYIVMEYVEGATFKDLVSQRGGRIPAGSLLHTIEPLFSALSAMHNLGLIHRDISPENLMLENGEIRLLDFGCARESRSGNATMTIALKQGYAPVEQYQNKGQGPWTDVYALSATIYYCLTGQKPPQSMDRLMEDELVPPRRMGVELTEKQEQALLHGMGVRPKRRFQSVEELHAALYEGLDWNGSESLDQPPQLSPAPQTESVAGEPAAGEPAPETSTPHTITKSETSGPPWKKLNLSRQQMIGIACGAAAALVLLVLLIWQPWKAPDVPVNPDSGATSSLPPEDSGAAASLPSEDSSAANHGKSSSIDDNAKPANAPVDFTNASNAVSETQLRKLLADDGVTAIKIDNGSSFYLDVWEPLELTKPLLVKGNMHMWAPLTMDGVELRVEGTVYGETLIHTKNGGSITFSGDGRFQTGGLLWTDHEDDLRYENGAREFDGQRLTVDEDELFKDAVRVSSPISFMSACHTGKPIIVEKSINVNEWGALTPQGPVLIEEGVTLNIEQGNLLNISGQTFINRGVLAGHFIMDDAAGQNFLINYGSMDIDMLFTGDGNVVNLGEWQHRSGQVYPGYNVFNDGTITMSRTEGTNYLDFACTVHNYGNIDCSVDKGYIVLAGNWSYNSGSITVGSGARLNVQGRLMNSGSITVEEGSELANMGLIECTGESPHIKLADGSWGGEGIILHGDREQLEVSDQELEHHHGQHAAFNGQFWYDDLRSVSSEQELLSALEDPDCSRIFITGPVIVDGDLTIPNKIVVTNSPLEVHGDINVYGEQGLFFSDSHGGLNTGALNVGDLAIGIISNGVGNLHAKNFGTIITLDDVQMQDGANITSDLHSHIIAIGRLILKDSTVSLNGGNLKSPCGRLELLGCTVSIDENSSFDTMGQLLLDSGSDLVNRGGMSIHGWAWQERAFAGQVENLGTAALGDNVVLCGDKSSGGFVNKGILDLFCPPEAPVVISGAFENLGEITASRGGRFKMDTDPANVTGVPQEFFE